MNSNNFTSKSSLLNSSTSATNATANASILSSSTSSLSSQQQLIDQPKAMLTTRTITKTESNIKISLEVTDYNIFETVIYPFCDDVSKYEKIMKIGQGTFGEVYKAKVKGSDKLVALKKILTENEKEGFPITALREIKILQVLNHENVVHLIEICSSKATSQNNYKSQFYLVFEFCDHDMAGLLGNKGVKFTLSEMKNIMQQLFKGLMYIHSKDIIHRDMKTANILVTKEGVLKLADFGLARITDIETNRYTNRVVTLWYRAPELLLGERFYGPPIDLWGAGCIMAELWTRSAIMQGNNEQQQLIMITQLCGSIEPSVWPNVDKYDLYNKLELPKGKKRNVIDRMKQYVKDLYALDLLDCLLILDPLRRMNCENALKHDFFIKEPLPSKLKLDNYIYNMYELTASSRRSQMIRNHHQQQSNNNNNNNHNHNHNHHNHHRSHATKQAMNDQHQERIY